MRNILGSEPRVTRFKINWDDSETQVNGSAAEEQQQDQGNAVFNENSCSQNAMEVM